MLKYAFDGFADHKAEHQELIESARELQQAYQQESKLVSSEDIGFLEHWLTEHILVTDMKLGSYLAQVM